MNLEALLNERSRTYFAKDTNYPGAWEPGGEDFFSAALMEADLMRRVMKPRSLPRGFGAFCRELRKAVRQLLLQPAIVTDRSDPKLVHLDGLNLSRAWCMRSIARALPADDPARAGSFRSRQTNMLRLRWLTLRVAITPGSTGSHRSQCFCLSTTEIN